MRTKEWSGTEVVPNGPLTVSAVGDGVKDTVVGSIIGLPPI